MNTILIVLPILTLLMFNLGLTLQPEDFKILIYKPKAVVIGLLGQIVILPAIAFVLAAVFRLNAIFYVGVILIACCPGGSSSNIFFSISKRRCSPFRRLNRFKQCYYTVYHSAAIALGFFAFRNRIKRKRSPAGRKYSCTEYPLYFYPYPYRTMYSPLYANRSRKD